MLGIIVHEIQNMNKGKEQNRTEKASPHAHGSVVCVVVVNQRKRRIQTSHTRCRWPPVPFLLLSVSCPPGVISPLEPALYIPTHAGTQTPRRPPFVALPTHLVRPLSLSLLIRPKPPPPHTIDATYYTARSLLSSSSSCSPSRLHTRSPHDARTPVKQSHPQPAGRWIKRESAC